MHDFGPNAGLVSEMVGIYLRDRSSVDDGWRAYFDALYDGGKPELAPPPQATVRRLTEPPPSRANTARQAGVTQLVAAYRERGHLLARIDPLGLLQLDAPPALTDFALPTFGLSEADLDEEFSVDIPGVEQATLRSIIDILRSTYCGSIGVEFTDIEEPAQRRWLQQQMESCRNRRELTPALTRRVLQRLSEAEVFESFVHRQFIGAKRFSLQGGESLIPLLDLLVEAAGEREIEELVLGMAHRGRLNVLVNLLNKDVREVFSAFLDREPEKHLGSGDVKYHWGHSTDRSTSTGRTVHLTLAFNPSHLEFVNPVVTGRVRAKQQRKGDREGKRVAPVLIHGDAAFMGQGVVAETLNLARLDGYCTGGTIHVLVNNQIGFTTLPRDSRSTRYASDLARMLRAPVFHVNGEDLEAVSHVAQLAVEYRQRFGQDVFIDLFCYRRYGHNEGDEPRFTQPVMYRAIDAKQSVREIFANAMVAAQKLDPREVTEAIESCQTRFLEALEYTKKNDVSWVPSAMGGVWLPYRGGRDQETPEVDTAVAASTLVELARKMTSLPTGFAPNRKVVDVYQKRLRCLEFDEPIDWGTGEALAFASLAMEGTPCRLSGQDGRRGTFAHRHAVLFDTETGETFTPLANLGSQQGRFDVLDSPLSETAVLGFDYGYSLDSPDALVLWEAQFGDFVNGAQVMVDQFISSAEDKWRRLSGIVLLLPHGYEGAGPEHSSARLERFLSLAAEDNMQICNPTTPAQMFHLLRRQVLRPYRKPLVVMTPKSLLRSPLAVSRLKDLTEGGFQRVLPDTTTQPSAVRRVLLCSGKVYYDLAEARKARQIQDVAIVRLEQLYPLDGSLWRALEGYAAGTELVWVQEEPWNSGAYFFILARLGEELRKRFRFSVVARDESASPATGSHSSHKLEQQRIVDRCFEGLTTAS